jgi:hypothetical protein
MVPSFRIRLGLDVKGQTSTLQRLKVTFVSVY